MKKEIIKKVNFNKGGTGGYTPRITLNTEWLKDMGINKEDNEIKLRYDNEKKEIVIMKK